VTTWMHHDSQTRLRLICLSATFMRRHFLCISRHGAITPDGYNGNLGWKLCILPAIHQAYIE
jgi:hypothetical protein